MWEKFQDCATWNSCGMTQCPIIPIDKSKLKNLLGALQVFRQNCVDCVTNSLLRHDFNNCRIKAWIETRNYRTNVGMNISRYNKHVEIFESLIVSESMKCLERGNWSIYNHFDVVKKVGKLLIVGIDVPQGFYQVSGLRFVDSIVIAESQSRYCPVPMAVI